MCFGYTPSTYINRLTGGFDAEVLEAQYPSCHPTNNAKALKADRDTMYFVVYFFLWFASKIWCCWFDGLLAWLHHLFIRSFLHSLVDWSIKYYKLQNWSLVALLQAETNPVLGRKLKTEAIWTFEKWKLICHQHVKYVMNSELCCVSQHSYLDKLHTYTQPQTILVVTVLV